MRTSPISLKYHRLPPCRTQQQNTFEYKLKEDNGKYFIFDPLRKKYILLTPEEWVRQHFVNYLISCKGYPSGRIGNEISLCLNGRKRRCDTVIYSQEGMPCVIVEYKAPHISISQDVFDQIVRYNIVLQVEYLIVSNGKNHYCCQIDYKNQSYVFLEEIPEYDFLQKNRAI